MKTINPAFTMSIKPMRSTGITGQSSKRGTCVIPNTYLKLRKLLSREKTCNNFISKTVSGLKQEDEEEAYLAKKRRDRGPKNYISFFQRSVLLNPCC